MPIEQTIGGSPLYFSGDALRLEITVRDGDTVSDPPLNLTPFTEIIFGVAKKQGSATLFEKKLSNGVSEIDPIDLANGRIDVFIDNADTAALKGDLYHELQLEPGPNTAMFGTFSIQKDSILP
jgi:hypothetical protein